MYHHPFSAPLSRAPSSAGVIIMCIVLRKKEKRKKNETKENTKKKREKKRKACGTRKPKSKEIDSSGDYCCLQMCDDHWFKLLH
jgi:hypothetical protein